MAYETLAFLTGLFDGTADGDPQDLQPQEIPTAGPGSQLAARQDLQPLGAGGPQDAHGDAAGPATAGGGPQGSGTGQDLQPQDSDAAHASTCPRCGSVRIAHGLRRWWCVDCGTEAGPVGDPQDLPAADDHEAAERPEDTTADAAQRLRKRPGWTLPSWPPEIPAGIIADPIPNCSGCGRLRVVPGQPGRPSGRCFGCWLERQRATPNHQEARR